MGSITGRIGIALILLFGTLVDYDMRRISVGDPLLGGYKSYTGVAEIEMRALRVVDGSEMGPISTRQESIDRGLGLARYYTYIVTKDVKSSGAPPLDFLISGPAD